MIVQFGTSRFLQAHVDLFASEARAEGQAVLPITIVQTTADPERARRLAAFSDPAGFPVIVRGLANGQPVDRTTIVQSVFGGLQAASDWDTLVELLRDEASYLVSNTGDLGYRVDAEDADIANDDVAPRSFVPMLVALLHARWQAGRPGLILLPCELVQRNGDTLRAAVVDLAKRQHRDPAYVAWLVETCTWANTLVDRIVSEPLNPAGAIAEPYALWAVERTAGLVLPFTHPAVRLVDDLEPYERLKLHILNLGHSWLADRWARGDQDAAATVRAAIAEPTTRAAFDRLFAEEVVPGFGAHGLADAATTYVEQTVERFANPFLDHRIADIHQNHAAKVARRVGGFIQWVENAQGPVPLMPELRALAGEAA
ncbi:mannitol dehydrogenase family protein [Sphingomonas sp. Y38-1Y]|uniref:mannitol dehydrogenase family protein n=1 Tax=Sphingomonas sp. Y38-1Y TaxID=3078265 RepID=UPI0028E2548A|nr:mannitol dehydrogenase family protein [Sphingomonas sp. Y38-1Y]